MKKIQTPDEAVKNIHDGAVIMVSGFMCCGQPLGLTEALIRKGVRNLTVIANDTGFPQAGVGKMVIEGCIRKLIASHIGLSPEAGRKMHSGEMEIELVPQGTFAERVRCGGAGLGGVLTPTGIGTEVEKGKKKIEVDARQYLLETPLRADFALVRADVCDKSGNGFIEKSAKNFNIIMAMAAQHTIVETEKIVETGELDPDRIDLPGIFIHTIAVEGWKGNKV